MTWINELKPGRLVRLAMIERCGGDITRAAKLLEMRPDALYAWVTYRERMEGTAHMPKRPVLPKKPLNGEVIQLYQRFGMVKAAELLGIKRHSLRILLQRRGF